MSVHDIAAMSDDELMEQWTALGDQVGPQQERLREFSAEHQRRTRKKQLLNAVGDLTDDDLVLLQEARAEGIETNEEVQSGDDL